MPIMTATRETEAAGPQVQGQPRIQTESKASKYNLVRSTQNKNTDKGQGIYLRGTQFCLVQERKKDEGRERRKEEGGRKSFC